MKEAIGGVFLFNIVIFFILLFTGIMCLTINRSKAYQIKDEIITIIEDNNGYNLDNVSNSSSDGVIADLVAAMSDYSYRTTGTCPSGYLALNRDGYVSSEESSLCIKKTVVDSDVEGIEETSYKCYYTVIVFYKMDLPILNEVFSFEVIGQTKTLYSKDYCG